MWSLFLLAVGCVGGTSDSAVRDDTSGDTGDQGGDQLEDGRANIATQTMGWVADQGLEFALQNVGASARIVGLRCDPFDVASGTADADTWCHVVFRLPDSPGLVTSCDVLKRGELELSCGDPFEDVGSDYEIEGWTIDSDTAFSTLSPPDGAFGYSVVLPAALARMGWSEWTAAIPSDVPDDRAIMQMNYSCADGTCFYAVMVDAGTGEIYDEGSG